MTLTMPILLVDFDDSFTFNIVSEFHKHSIEVEVINYKNFDEHIVSRCLESKYQAVLFGPGPGHPKEYKKVFKLIEVLIDHKNIKLIGICLGHQILMNILGHYISNSKNIIHGSGELIDFKNWRSELEECGYKKLKHKVSRYNSLCVLVNSQQLQNYEKIVYSESNEVMGFMADHILSMQFHPESVGTNCPDIFFKLMVNFMR